MRDKRITIVSGHYGSGKPNIALNLVMELKKRHEKVAIADIDIVNPYFRTKDSEKILSETLPRSGLNPVSVIFQGSTP